MLRSRLYRYKLSEFSYLTGIDTYRLKKLDQQGILPARTINGRRYYDETAVMLAIFYSDNDYAKPTMHNIVIALGKLLTLVKVYNKNHKTNLPETEFELLHEQELKNYICREKLTKVDVETMFKRLIDYLEQVRNAVNLNDKPNKIEDEQQPRVKINRQE